MKIKNLLVLALTMFGTALTVQAQVVKEDFSAPQTKTATEQGYYEFINLQPTTEGAEKVDKWTVGDGVLSIDNSVEYPCTNQKWQRAIKFRNLPLKEKTLYKLSLDLKTNETYVDTETSTEAPGYLDMKIMQGDENADICIQGADGSEQRVNYELNSGDSKTYSKTFYFADLAKQNAAYEAACAGKELYDPAKFFVGINVYAPGKYVMDNILLEEVTSPVEKVGFYGQAIKVYYGDQLNAAELCAGKSQYVLDNSCATVSINGTAADIISVEIKKDGYLYIFLDNELNSTDVVKVTFNAPEAVQFAGAFAGISLNFSDVQAVEDETIDAASWLMEAPELVTSSPVDGSFSLDQNISEISFTFDKNVYTVKTDAGDAPVATLSNGETLVLTTTDELSKTLTFKRPSTDQLPKGSYTVTLSNIFNEYGTAADDMYISFEVGKVKLAETVYTDLFTNLLTGNNGSQPDGWTIMVGGENWTGGEAKADDGAACRNINVTGTNGEQTAFYLCDRAGYTFMQYGDKEGYNITLPKGNIEFSVIAVGHEAAARTVEFRVEDLNGNEIASGKGQTTVVAGDFTTVEAAGTIAIKFSNPTEQKVILKIHEPEGGYTACRVLGFKARSYVMTEGDNPDSQVCLEDKDFGGAADNAAPAAGSGWKLYENNVLKNAGQDYNYNGSRIFKLSITNLPVAYYTGSSYQWPNNYATYGEAAEGEPTLTIPAGSVDFTYYASSWKTDLRMLHMQLLKQDGTVVYERTDSIANVNMGGSRSASVEAMKIQFSTNIAEAGNYILKFGADGEAFVGNIKIEKLGSKAAYYAGLLKAAVAEAQAELDLCAEEKYNGTTKSAITAAIVLYSGENDMTTAAEYNAAIALLNELTKALKTRRVAINDYATAITNIDALRSSVVGTKYERLDAYKALDAVYSKYKDVSPSSLEDDELSATTLSLQNNYNWLNNMVTTGVGLLTKQTDNLAAMLDPADSDVARAAESITDDQDLAYILKLKALKAIYEKCAAGDPFKYVELDTINMVENEIIDSIDVTPFIQNANLYSTCITRDLTDVAAIPGWSFPVKEGTVSQQWSWSAWSGSEYCPVNDVFLLNGWNGDFAMEQNVYLLPVGTYRYVSGTQDRGFADTSDDKVAALETRGHWTVTGTDGTNDITGEIFSYIYWQTGAERDSVAFDISEQGQWYGLTDDNSKLIAVNAANDLPYGDLTIGARAVSYQSSASVDNFRLYMTAKKAGFDYAKAATAVQGLIDAYVAGIESVKTVAPAAARNKYIQNGKLVIEKNGKQFNAAGQLIK